MFYTELLAIWLKKLLLPQKTVSDSVKLELSFLKFYYFLQSAAFIRLPAISVFSCPILDIWYSRSQKFSPQVTESSLAVCYFLTFHNLLLPAYQRQHSCVLQSFICFHHCRLNFCSRGALILCNVSAWTQLSC